MAGFYTALIGTSPTIQWPGLSPPCTRVQGAATPLHPRDVARAFKAKQAGTMLPVLDALAAIGQARKLADGRYAA